MIYFHPQRKAAKQSCKTNLLSVGGVEKQRRRKGQNRSSDFAPGNAETAVSGDLIGPPPTCVPKFLRPVRNKSVHAV